MIKRLSSRLLFGTMALLCSASLVHAQRTTAVAPPLVVVELFQSQGCSSCPPAEANLNAIAGRPDILALSYGVTYWDDLGWKDTFASAAFTDRQWIYARHRGRSQVWTPQVYVDGHVDLVGTDGAQLARTIAKANMQGPPLSWQDGHLSVGAGTPAARCDVWLVRYDPRTINVAIGAGENGGHTLPHRNVVRELIHLGSWDGSPHTFDLPPAKLAGLATAALVQIESGGDILSAGREPRAR